MNSPSSTAGSVAAASNTALATPRIRAMSPPIRTCTFIVPILVVWKVAMSTNSCGTIVRRDAASISGLIWTSCGAAPVGFGQPGQHPGRVRGGVVAHQPDRVRLLPVAQVDRALAGSERRRQRPAAGLVAHVRAVRQVVGAELPHPQLIEERRLVAQPPGGVERRLVRAGQPAQRGPDQLERVLPRDRHVLVGSRRRSTSARRAARRPPGRSRSSRPAR